ncbi:MAG: family N-acetyltransferase [Glaciihabitans sp.]|nr:family N-acetyltransferase [Glaciihabitans sp.]
MSDVALSHRVAAPAQVPLPQSNGVSWRPATIDDLDSIVDACHLVDREDHPWYLTPRDEIEDDLTSSFVNTATDTLLGVAADGEVVAYGVVILGPTQTTLVRCILFGWVVPQWRGRGIGRELLAWQEARGMQQLATSEALLPGRLVIFSAEAADAQVALARAAGYRVFRYFLELIRDLSEPIPEVPAPEGIHIVPMDLPKQSGALFLAQNDAFRDHWGSLPWTLEQWDQHIGASNFRPDLSVVAVDDRGEIAGFVHTEVNPDDFAGQGFSSGYISIVGVPRAFRGRRIALAVLAEALRRIKADGLEQAVLDVDSENPTGALALYEGVGFRAGVRSLYLAKEY